MVAIKGASVMSLIPCTALKLKKKKSNFKLILTTMNNTIIIESKKYELIYTETFSITISFYQVDIHAYYFRHIIPDLF